MRCLTSLGPVAIHETRSAAYPSRWMALPTVWLNNGESPGDATWNVWNAQAKARAMRSFFHNGKMEEQRAKGVTNSDERRKVQDGKQSLWLLTIKNRGA